MATVTRTKDSGKQMKSTSLSAEAEQSLMALESICMHILEDQFVHDRDDIEGMVWQRKFKNLVMPVSLALREYKGPRHFHQHYKHREDDETILHPVLEDPATMMRQVCRSALAECQAGFGGLQDEEMTQRLRGLEQALKRFLSSLQD